jgi:hypothetical protein
MAIQRCWLDLPYGLNEDTVCIYAVSNGLLSDAELLDVLPVTFCIAPGMRVPISGGISPC